MRRQEGRKKKKRKSKEKGKKESFGCIDGSFSERGTKE
jgi:hypothetical protein